MAKKGLCISFKNMEKTINAKRLTKRAAMPYNNNQKTANFTDIGFVYANVRGFCIVGVRIEGYSH